MDNKKPLTVEQILAQHGIRMEDSPTGKFLAIPKAKYEEFDGENRIKDDEECEG